MYQNSEEHIDPGKLQVTDEELSEIQNNIHHIERRIRMADSDKKIDVEGGKLEIKKNDLEIKQLMMQVKELEVKIERSQKADENIISKELRERSKELGNLKGKSAKEVINLADANVLEFDKKCKSIGHELQLLKLAFMDGEKQLKDMETKCNEDFGNDPTEFDSLQRIRELENEQQKVNKDIIECEVAQNKYKMMKEQLQTNQLSYPVLLLNMEKEYEAQQADASPLEINGVENPEIILSKEFKVQSGNGDGDFDVNCLKNMANEKKKSSFDVKTSEKETSTTSDQQIELLEMQEKFDRIKEVTHASDIQDAERRFLVQKSMHEDLIDLKQRLVKSLNELRSQKKHLDSRMTIINGGNSIEPKRDMIDEFQTSNSRYEEQEKRRNNAKLELEKLTSLLSEIESQEKELLHVLVEQFSKVNVSKGDLTAIGTIKKIEEILQTNLGE